MVDGEACHLLLKTRSSRKLSSVPEAVMACGTTLTLAGKKIKRKSYTLNCTINNVTYTEQLVNRRIKKGGSVHLG